MSLYPLLKDRASINILKILSDNEELDKKYTMSLWELRDRLPVQQDGNTLRLLEQSGLISVEDSESNGVVLGITQKGKDFVTQFDKLIEIMRDEKEEVKAFSVEYDLAEDVRKLLIMCYDLGAEAPVDIRTIALDMFPKVDITGKLPELIEAADRLVDLNLLERFDEDDEPAYAVTDTGERVVKEQLKE